MILLKLGEIKGTSTTAKHGEWITIDSIHYQITNRWKPGDEEAPRGASSSWSALTLEKAADISSPELFKGAASGKPLGEALIHFIQVGGADVGAQVYLELKLTGANISSYSQSSEGERPKDTFTITFATFMHEFREFTEAKFPKTHGAGWDLLTDTPM